MKLSIQTQIPSTIIQKNQQRTIKIINNFFFFKQKKKEV